MDAPCPPLRVSSVAFLTCALLWLPCCVLACQVLIATAVATMNVDEEAKGVPQDRAPPGSLRSQALAAAGSRQGCARAQP